MQQKPALSTSQLFMWRSLLAIAWADGNCGPEEIAYFAKVFDNLPRYYALTAEQRNKLAEDLESPQKAELLFPHINDPEVRDTLICYAGDLVMLDGVLDPSEDAILKRLRLWQHPAHDKEELRTEIRQFRAERMQESEQERRQFKQEAQGAHPLYAAVDRLLTRLGIDPVD